ncbi:tryptophan--tRNA ligase [Wolbachia endosymbiont of Cimex lectularius]|uniref:tryptophan--tRNA ligase n=1 Tax=Wolbachia endosymbiont of Cimex lectularius TaxID=246273 RepID=UPI0006CF1CC1|nr:tryptophan--tRNA ligase [Wolbachia endosymbiont of Cimex lectularius]
MTSGCYNNEEEKRITEYSSAFKKQSKTIIGNQALKDSIVFSGIQPSGILHLGNYLGAIKQWIDLQNKYESLFCIVDLHAITANKLPASELKSNILKTAAAYIACGIDPEKSIIFSQSTVSGHAELGWLLGCYTPVGWLSRMTQFKDKAGSDKQKASLGLYSYPVLMAADILLYKTKYVPVGDDQKQHLELTRDVALTFNNHYKLNYFVVPEILVLDHASRIMSLRDGTSKMSKSDPSEYSRISLDDTDDFIAKKIEKAKTDSMLGFYFPTLKCRPEVSNLINIYSVLSSLDVERVCEEMNKHDMRHFKKELADLIISVVSPIREKMRDLLKDQSHLHEMLKKGTEKAAEIANHNIKEIKDIIGFIQ